jgi:hypothetical protein
MVFSSSVLIQPMLPVPPGRRGAGGDGRIAEIEDGLRRAAGSTAAGRPVIKAFSTIRAQNLLERGRPAGSEGRIALPVAGDDPAAKQTAMRLVEELGSTHRRRRPGRVVAPATRQTFIRSRPRQREPPACAHRSRPRAARRAARADAEHAGAHRAANRLRRPGCDRLNLVPGPCTRPGPLDRRGREAEILPVMPPAFGPPHVPLPTGVPPSALGMGAEYCRPGLALLRELPPAASAPGRGR